MSLNSQNTTLVTVPRGGLITGERVAAHPRTIGSERADLLSVFPGEAIGTTRAVRVLALSEVPEGVLAIGEDLAAALGLDSDEQVIWELLGTGFRHCGVDELTLEVTVEQPIDDAVSQLTQSHELVGRLVWLPAGQTPQSLTLEVDQVPYRVREIFPSPDSGAVVYEITGQTRLKVYAPSYKSGIDIVILADRSGSMSADDLTDIADYAPETRSWNPFSAAANTSRSLSRAEALRRALKKLLQVRLQVTGRVSRIALVEFTHESRIRFPRLGGMAEMDENSPPHVIQEFNDAVASLVPETAGTDIGQALHFAADLLYQHGKPGNDRLVVLISDGAHWKPKGENDTGEIISAIEDPLSLMEHLHREMRIHLHAIGISTREIYERYCRQRSKALTESFTPNHELLERLVAVGGGDPAATGDTEVLQRYFGGLGSGVTRNLQLRTENSKSTLRHFELEALARAADQQAHAQRERVAMRQRSNTQTEVSNELRTLTDEITGLFKECNEYTLRTTTSWHLFDPTPKVLIETFGKFMVTETQNKHDFDLFIRHLHQCFCESVHKKLHKRKDEKGARPDDLPPPLPEVKEILNGEKMGNLDVLRNDWSHDRRDPRDVRKLRETLQQLVGAVHIEDGDAPRWSRLQREVLKLLRNVLREILVEFRQVQVQPVDDSEFVFRW